MAFAAIAAVATALVMMPATPASANVPTSPASLQTVTVQVNGVRGQLASGQANCPDGTTAISASVALGQFHSLTAGSNFSGYTAKALIPVGSTVSHFLLSVHCASQSLVTDAPVVLVGDKRSHGPVATRNYTCPEGRYAMGGGGQFDFEDDTARMISSMPSADGHGWTFSGSAVGSRNPLSYRVRCFNAAASGLTVRVDDELVRFDSPEMVTTAGGCTRGLALAGGVGVLNGDGTPARFGVITTTRWDGEFWQGGGFLPGATVNDRLLVRALCVTPV
jgi:hypothetical protein